jgi:hypothetical protein
MLAFLDACEAGDLERVRAGKAECEYDVETMATACGLAARGCHLQVLQCLFEGVRVDVKDVVASMYEGDTEHLALVSDILDADDKTRQEEQQGVITWLLQSHVLTPGTILWSASEKGKTSVVRYLLENHNPGVWDLENPVSCFLRACKSGVVDVAALLLPAVKAAGMVVTKERALRAACESGKFDMAQWVLDMNLPLQGPGLGGCLCILCRSDSPDQALFDLLLTQGNEGLDSLEMDDFLGVVASGNVALAQIVLSAITGSESLEAEMLQEAFLIACSSNSLDMVLWIQSLGGVDIMAVALDAFVTACKHNALEVAKWLFSCTKEMWRGESLDDILDFMMISPGKIDVDMVSWMYEVGVLSLKNLTRSCSFALGCTPRHRRVLKWILDTWRRDNACDETTIPYFIRQKFTK